MIVLKIGGGKDLDIDAFLDDIAKLTEPCVLIHGGAEYLNDISSALGHPPRMITSVSGIESRYTDAKTMEMFQMVYCGWRNKTIAQKLQQRGINAIGLSGIDGQIWKGKRKKAIRIIENGKKKIIRDDLSGKIESVNTDFIELLLSQGYFPVLTPPAISEDGHAINVDGDRAAAITASTLSADTLIIFSNIPGLLRDKDDENSLIDHLKFADLDDAMDQYAKGRMKKKVMGAKEALQSGVKKVIFADARVSHPITKALQGAGTTIE